MTKPPYSPEDDAIIMRGVQEGWSRTRIAAEVGRSIASIDQRIYLLRSEGRLGPPTRTERQISHQAAMEQPVCMDGDDDLVAACLGHGGFPRAEVIAGQTYWLDHRDMLWGYQAKVAA